MSPRTLQLALDQASTERPVCDWLKKNPWVMCHSLGRLAFPTMLVSEFPFGTDFRADFVGLGPFSGGWCISFIELEPPGASLFTQNGSLAKRLNGAVAQVDAWKTFVEANRQAVLKDLSKYAQSRELIQKWKKEPTDNVGWKLYNPRASLHFYYFIVIGRRALLSEEQMQKKADFRKRHDIEIMTYDRVLDAAVSLHQIEKDRQKGQT